MIHFVGAGPGAEDLITVRGQRLLRQADVVIYAGSLVNPELLKETKKCCKTYNSAHMTLEEVLEVMEEGQVTVDGTTYRMPSPFIVLATQNPVDFVGTYPLPEAQLDRFFMRVSIGYPSQEEEIDILERYTSGARPMEELKPICSSQDIVKLQQQVDTVYTSREVRAYISAIAAASRRNGALQLGVSTRAAISLLRAGQARALLQGRDYVSPEDIQKMAEPVLAHRLVLSPEARMRNMTAQRVLGNILGAVQVPVKAR